MQLKKSKISIFSQVLVFFVFSLAIFVIGSFVSRSLAQDVSPDAIAIRVIKNPDNYSALRWYKEKGFTGSPQSTTVDGYEAVRDGRTVYVNAANITAATLYTNIYLISYNQSAEKDTQDIFGKILSHWKFNTNITVPGICNESNTIVCTYDTDCPNDEYCLSEKAKIIRDTNRLAILAEAKIALEKFNDEKSYYPKLTAGSYLPNKTISTWPSWQNILAQELKMKLPLDPINKLGACTGYHPVTCWNEAQKTFADADLVDPQVNLPANSRALVYWTNQYGSSYEVCAVMESGYVSGVGSGACAGSEVIVVGNSVGNRLPVFVNDNFPQGHTAQAYDAYVQATDPDGDALSWSIDVNPLGQWAGWSAAPVLRNTAVVSHKQIHADVVGIRGNYSVAITVNDGRGGIVTKSFTFIVPNNPPIVTVSDRTITVGSNVLIGSPIDIVVNDLDGDNVAGTILGLLPPGLGPLIKVSNALFNISGIPNGPTPVPASFPITISIQDALGAITNKNMIITIDNKKPVVAPPVCLSPARWQVPYNCALSASDADGHAIGSFTLVPGTFPAGMSVDAAGAISGNLTELGNFTVRVYATDQYAAVSNEVSFPLTVNSFCGDNIKQSLNTEHRGGPTDNGVEFCDGSDGVAASPMDSSINRQYDCTTPPICPLVGACMNTCALTGGYCGDGAIQAVFAEQCEADGGGTSINDQYECNSCVWAAGWCGNSVCDAGYEFFAVCPGDCMPNPSSEFSICTHNPTQPACYAVGTHISPTINWTMSSVQSDYCDCDGMPVLNDCPYGAPCLASYQEAFYVQIDDSPNYLSPEHVSGMIVSANNFYTVPVAGLLPNTLYYFRVMAKDQYGTWSDWAECVGPFTTSPQC